MFPSLCWSSITNKAGSPKAKWGPLYLQQGVPDNFTLSVYASAQWPSIPWAAAIESESRNQVV